MESVLRVHTLTEYEALPRIEKEDYFWRFYYFATTGVFEPRSQTVPLSIVDDPSTMDKRCIS